MLDREDYLQSQQVDDWLMSHGAHWNDGRQSTFNTCFAADWNDAHGIVSRETLGNPIVFTRTMLHEGPGPDTETPWYEANRRHGHFVQGHL
jgi:hypothetical protein